MTEHILKGSLNYLSRFDSNTIHLEEIEERVGKGNK